MREILFRGFHENPNGKTIIIIDGKAIKGEWVYGYYFKYDIFDCGKMIDCIDSPDESIGYYYAQIRPRPIIPETLGQFTGLYDKNGKEIWEGDFVLLNKLKCLISFSETLGGWHISYPVRDDNDFPLENLLFWWYYMGVPDIEVIGNVHEKE